MTSYVSVKTKSGAYYYYLVTDGKKKRVSKDKVPVKDRKTPKMEKQEKTKAKTVTKKVSPKPVKKMKKKTTTQCLKVASLRKELKDPDVTLETWMANPNNVYVGRVGRIFIGTGDDKYIFHYKGSKFANPYKVGKKEGEYTLAESIELYKQYLIDNNLVNKAKKELQGKNLGCFCSQSGGRDTCHAKVLSEIANE